MVNDIYNTSRTISTPFLYYPRVPAPSPLPPPLLTDSLGFVVNGDWGVFESMVSARHKGMQDIATKLYVPASRAYSLSEKIPFHLLLCSNPISLAAFLPLNPTANTLGRPKPMRLQVMRQCTIDVRYVSYLP